MTSAFPLQWPHGVPRTKARRDSAFKVSHSVAFDEMMKELSLFSATGIVVSTNIPLRRDGSPYRDGLTERLEDPGVAVYFTKNKRQNCLPCDTYARPWENIRAIAKAIEAFRTMERHGAHQILDQAFTGFIALPPPGAPTAISWWVILGVPPDATAERIQAAWKAKVRLVGELDRAALNIARDEGMAANG